MRQRLAVVSIIGWTGLLQELVLKVLIITTAHLFSSATTSSIGGCFFVRFVEEMMRCGLEPTIVTPRSLLGVIRRLFRGRRGKGLPCHDLWKGADIFRPPYLSLALCRRMRFQARSFRYGIMPLCRRLHRERQFRLVVGYGFDMAAYAAAQVARTLGLRSVAWAIGTDVHTIPNLSRQNASLLRENVESTTLILTESADLRRLLRERCPLAANVHTYYKGIDLEDMLQPADRPSLRAKLSLGAEKTYMMFAGHVGVTKGVWEFYNAFKALSGSHRQLCAILVGDGKETESLCQRASRDGLADRFQVTGFLSRPTVLEYMRAVDLMVFPSHAEGLPNVVMEALAAGLPVVATDVGGTREVLATGRTGILVPPRDVIALTQAVEQMLQKPSYARALADRGKRLITSHFDVRRNAPVAIEILRGIAEGGSPEQPVPPCADTAPGCLPIEEIDTSDSSDATP